MSTISIITANEIETFQLATHIAPSIAASCFITLSGQLGSGKTTFTRGILNALGHTGNVKSPTFTIVETYHLKNHLVYHFDLYRIHNSEELELIGFRDYFQEKALILLEWPEHAAGLLPETDIDCNIAIQNTNRIFTLTANTNLGLAIIQRLKQHEK